MKFRSYVPVKVKTHLYIDEAGLQRSGPNGEIMNHNICDSLNVLQSRREGVQRVYPQIILFQTCWQSKVPEFKISQNHRNKMEKRPPGSSSSAFE